MRLEPVIVVVPGDLHLTEAGLENHQVAQWMVEEVNTLVRPDFVQFIGDNVQDATEQQFRLFDELRDRLVVPHFALVGDHDVKDDPFAARFKQHVAAAYGATSLRGYRFIRLNTQESRPLGLSPKQIGWFRGEIDSALSRGERVVIFQHNYPYQIWEDFDGQGIDAWRAIVQTRRVEVIVCGHTHYWQVANDGRNVTIATRSIGDPEGGQPGYALLYLQGADLAVTYRTVEDLGPIVLITHPRDRILATGPRHIVKDSDQVVVRTWSGGPVVSVRCLIDGDGHGELEPAGEGLWCGPLEGDRLAKGVHTLEVIASIADGAAASGRVGFMVDRTGRYTAVPLARPAVESTAFC